MTTQVAVERCDSQSQYWTMIGRSSPSSWALAWTVASVASPPRMRRAMFAAAEVQQEEGERGQDDDQYDAGEQPSRMKRSMTFPLAGGQ